MFSVGASPFNSRSRQLYGGWALDGAGNNLWGKKQFYTMSARYNPSEAERQRARDWLKAYREVVRNNPARKAAIRREGKPYWVDAILPAMTPAQKASIWQSWLQVPFTTNKDSQIASRMARKAPFPNARMMNEFALYGVPMLPKREDIEDYTDPELNDMFRNMDTIFRNSRVDPTRTQRVADMRRDILAAADALVGAAQAAVEGAAQGGAP